MARSDQQGQGAASTLTGEVDLAGQAAPRASESLSERRAKLLAEPLQLTVNGVATLDQSNNLTGLERQIASVEAATAPDDTTGGDTLVIAPLQSAHRRRHRHWWR
ncbi:hypothetical protein [Streptomyces sp. NPDC052036]|uniref:hypothetical protein n=1 Tax=Streptomyces sp. NPDC052036 TaxID=3155171 RepID=UPI00342C1D15